MRDVIKVTTKLLLSVVTLCTVVASIMDAGAEVKASAKTLKEAYKSMKKVGK